MHKVPETLAAGGTIMLPMRVCRPPGDAPARLVVINHGVSADPQHMQPQACTDEAPQWFLTRGYAVALPLRRGYGGAGTVAESAGDCSAPNDVRAGLAGAADIAAVVDYVIALPFVQADRVVVVGEGTGGWATTAYGSLPHPHVSALISLDGSTGQACRGDLLAYSAAYFATTARTPLLWVCAANDAIVSPATAKAAAQSYQAGGGALEFEPVGAARGGGQTLLSGPGNTAIWCRLVEHYLSTT